MYCFITCIVVDCLLQSSYVCYYVNIATVKGNSFSSCKAWYTPATKLHSTRSTLLKVDHCRNRQQSRLLPIRSTLLPVLATNRQQLEFDSLSWLDFVANTVEFVANTVVCCQCQRDTVYYRLSTKSTVLNSTLSPVCTGLYETFRIY